MPEYKFADIGYKLIFQLSGINKDKVSSYPIDVCITDSNGTDLECRVVPKLNGVYDVNLQPKRAGQHLIKVKFLGQPIFQSNETFTVMSNDPVSRIGQLGDELEDMEYPRAVAMDHNNNL